MFYDGDCRLCAGSVARWRGLLERRGFGFAPLQTDWVRARLGLAEGELPEEMKVVTRDGRLTGGVGGLAELARAIWWAWPLFVMAQVRGVRGVMDASYRRLAANRRCFNGACEMPRRSSLGQWLPLFCLPVAALLLRDALPAWVFMWTMACALYAGCKWLTFSNAVRNIPKTNSVRVVGYLLAWPGMDAAAFLKGIAPPAKPRVSEWIFVFAKTLLGAVLVWFVTRLLVEAHPLLAGWIGMIGVIFILHFGLFHLLALTWQTAGVNVMPLMRNPARACSLADFWGRRWNTAFHEIVHRFTFRPLLKRTGATVAMLLVFLFSGLIHELVITLPACGGYGLPTGYFLLQGLGVVFERTAVGRRVGLGRGVRGWLFTLLVAAGPAFWLFPPPFIHRVILPMLHAIGAT